jgi:hypothetical protein
MNLYRILEGNFPRQGGDWALEVPEVGRYSCTWPAGTPVWSMFH